VCCQQGQQDSWGSEGSKQRASPVDWNNSQNWSAQQKKMQMQSGGGGGGGGGSMAGRSGGPTQMRSQMLQDLVRRGFKVSKCSAFINSVNSASVWRDHLSACLRLCQLAGLCVVEGRRSRSAHTPQHGL
jgi:hypothetical protein